MILACNYYQFNTSLKNCRIEDIILENDFEMEKYLVIYKKHSFEFIILFEYITFKSIIIITSMPLKNTSNKNFLTTSFKQLRSYTKS